MPEEKFYQFDSDPEGVLWLHQFSDHLPIAYCSKHQVPLETETYSSNDEVFCPVDRQDFQFPNDWMEQQQRVTLALINRDKVKDLPIIRVDSEGADVVAKERLKLVDEYWIAGKVSDTSRGIQIMIQIGRRDADNEKVQIFVDPGRERVGFDLSDKDKHPAGVFAELQVKFKDSVTIIKNPEEYSSQPEAE